MKTVCDWLTSANGGASFLAGTVEEVWTTRSTTGTVTPNNPDDFYGFAEDHGIALRIARFIAWLRRFFSFGNAEKRIHHIDTSSSSGLGQGVSTIIASVLPIVPIIVFYFVKQLLLRIGLILVFTAVFAALLVVGLQLSPDTSLGITTA
jgi:VIT1/CCC1 family predicted Fe2+/Mn2+ transporter